MEELFEKRKRMEETDFLEERQKRERDFQEKTDMLRINHADESCRRVGFSDYLGVFVMTRERL